MNIVIINKDLGLYLANLDRWTTNVQEAQKFTSTIEALDFCLNNYLTDLSILMHFDKSPGDVCQIDFQSVPVRIANPAPAAPLESKLRR